MKIKERTKKFIEENKTVLIGCGLGVVGSVGIFIAGKRIGEYNLIHSLSEQWGIDLLKPNAFTKLKDNQTFKDLFPSEEILPDAIKSVGIDNSMDEIKGVFLIQKK